MRGIFFDENEARAVERHLLADGYEAALTRERFAGEDDEEGHPWAVVTDAPPIVLELLVEQFDGWLDDEPPAASSPPPPVPLPRAPRRRHRPEDQG